MEHIRCNCQLKFIEFGRRKFKLLELYDFQKKYTWCCYNGYMDSVSFEKADKIKKLLL